MIREFKQDVGGTADKPRFKAGEIKDWPIQTWRTMAENLGLKIKKLSVALDKFSKPVNIS